MVLEFASVVDIISQNGRRETVSTRIWPFLCRACMGFFDSFYCSHADYQRYRYHGFTLLFYIGLILSDLLGTHKGQTEREV